MDDGLRAALAASQQGQDRLEQGQDRLRVDMMTTCDRVENRLGSIEGQMQVFVSQFGGLIEQLTLREQRAS